MEDIKGYLGNYYKGKEKKKKEKGERREKKIKEIKQFFLEVVEPAFKEIEAAFKKYDKTVTIIIGEIDASITIDDEEFTYSLLTKDTQYGIQPVPEIGYQTKEGKWLRQVGYMKSGTQDYTIKDFLKEDIIQHFIEKHSSRV